MKRPEKKRQSGDDSSNPSHHSSDMAKGHLDGSSGWLGSILSHQISHKISPLLVILDGHPFIKAFIPIIISYKISLQNITNILIDIHHYIPISYIL